MFGFFLKREVNLIFRLLTLLGVSERLRGVQVLRVGYVFARELEKQFFPGGNGNPNQPVARSLGLESLAG